MRLVLVFLVLCDITNFTVTIVELQAKMEKLRNSEFGKDFNENKYKGHALHDFNEQPVHITAFGVVLDKCEEQ
ncbi:hypothetical protein PENTCL1PPCAC_2724, partial [Pristionchus entomophagus]